MTGYRVSAYRALSSESRVKLLRVLQSSGDKMTVDELAADVELHVNTAREHLDCLISAGFVAREPEVRCTRGRPRMLYQAVARSSPEDCDDRARVELARILVDGFGKTVDSPEAAAERAGFAWGKLVGSEAEGTPVPGATMCTSPSTRAFWQQLATLQAQLEALGFEPEVDIESLEMHMHRCPFYALARENTDVVCGVCLGLSRGILAQVGSPLEAERLEPLVSEQHCVLRLSRG